MTYVQTEIEPESIIDAMNVDSSFAHDMWFELAEKLEMGLLLDNACDVFSSDAKKAEYIATQFEFFARMLRAQIDHF